VLPSTRCRATAGRSTDAALHDAYALNCRAPISGRFSVIYRFEQA
jgi:hypothetical protein